MPALYSSSAYAVQWCNPVLELFQIRQARQESITTLRLEVKVKVGLVATISLPRSAPLFHFGRQWQRHFTKWWHSVSGKEKCSRYFKKNKKAIENCACAWKKIPRLEIKKKKRFIQTFIKWLIIFINIGRILVVLHFKNTK